MGVIVYPFISRPFYDSKFFRSHAFFWQNILAQILLAPTLSLVYTASKDLISERKLQDRYLKRAMAIYVEDWKMWPIVNLLGMAGQRKLVSMLCSRKNLNALVAILQRASNTFALKVSQIYAYGVWIPHRLKTYENVLVFDKLSPLEGSDNFSEPTTLEATIPKMPQPAQKKIYENGLAQIV